MSYHPDDHPTFDMPEFNPEPVPGEYEEERYSRFVVRFATVVEAADADAALEAAMEISGVGGGWEVEQLVWGVGN